MTTTLPPSFRLREEPDFARFWTGQAISVVGSEISSMAIPLIAILVLGAGAFDQGVLFFVKQLPALLFGLYFGVLVDRFAKRTLLVLADLVRMALLVGIIVLYLLDGLGIPVLIGIAFLLGTFDVLGRITGQAYIPTLVPESRLLTANGKLQKVTTLSEVTGGSFAGALIQLMTAPIAIVLDAISYAVSAWFIGRVRQPGAPTTGDRPETDGVTSAEERREKRRIVEGLRFILGHLRLRSITFCTATSNFFSAMMVSLYLLFVTQHLNMSPFLIGLLLSGASCTALLSNFFTTRSMNLFGVRGTLVFGQFVMALGCLVLPFATGPTFVICVFLVVSHGVFMLGSIAFMTTQITYRQQVTPAEMQGRVHAGNYVLSYGAYALGAMAGGICGEWIGIRETLMIGALGHVVAAAWLLPRRVRVEFGGRA